MSDIKIQITTGVATVKALADRWKLSPVSDKDARIVWNWLIDNEPGLVKKIHGLGSAQAATEWHDKIRRALYGDR
jgi:hypothetical protein